MISIYSLSIDYLHNVKTQLISTKICYKKYLWGRNGIKFMALKDRELTTLYLDTKFKGICLYFIIFSV